MQQKTHCCTAPHFTLAQMEARLLIHENSGLSCDLSNARFPWGNKFRRVQLGWQKLRNLLYQGNRHSSVCEKILKKQRSSHVFLSVFFLSCNCFTGANIFYSIVVITSTSNHSKIHDWWRHNQSILYCSETR